MNNDRFRFRVWMNDHREYVPDNAINDYRLDNKGRLWYCGMTPYIVSNYIIEQCTGIKDKNGKLIFEGDVLYDPRNGNYYKVTHDDEQCLFEARGIDMEYMYEYPEDFPKMEIVGNIHEEK